MGTDSFGTICRTLATTTAVQKTDNLMVFMALAGHPNWTAQNVIAILHRIPAKRPGRDEKGRRYASSHTGQAALMLPGFARKNE